MALRCQLILLVIGIFWLDYETNAYAVRGRVRQRDRLRGSPQGPCLHVYVSFQDSSPRAGMLHHDISAESEPTDSTNLRRNNSNVGGTTDDDTDDDDDDELPELNVDLYTKARTFGQSASERQRVEETLQRLETLMNSKIRPAGAQVRMPNQF